MPVAERVVINSDDALVELFPRAGGRISRFSISNIDVLVPLTVDCFDPDAWPRAGAYPMVPYHNRIEGGELCFRGQTHGIASHPDTAPHSLHGPAQREPWLVVEQDAVSATLHLDRHADRFWPWSFSARQTFSLERNRLTLGMSVVNTTSRAMPAGLGWHPYIAGCRKVGHDAQFRWPIRSDYLPVGTRESLHHHEASPVNGTDYLSGWTKVVIETDAGLNLSLAASSNMNHLVLHKGDGDYACIEPASHVANAFNLGEQGVLETGACVLGPGEQLSATIDLTVDRIR